MKKNIKILFLCSICLKPVLSEKFLFSVIIAIYNTGRYLDDSVGSILNQTIDINKIQIILVNDGSTDETEKVCLKYKKMYKYNVNYINLEHNGVSYARNIGIEYAEGEFINFLDADDKWDNKAFRYVLSYFRLYRHINIMSCRMIFFEGKQSYHPLDYKYSKSRIVNLTEEYNCIQLSCSSSFFRFSSIKKLKFKEGIFVGEDTRFINNILLLNPTMGIIKEAIYYYRKRADSTSTIQNKVQNEDFYFSIINSVDNYLIKKSIKLYNYVLPFIQFYVAYNTLFRIILPTYKLLDEKRLKKYFELVKMILVQIEDKYILEQKILSWKEKFLALSKKYDKDIRNNIILKNHSFMYSDYKLINCKTDKSILVWRILEIKNNILHIEGKDNLFFSTEKFYYYCKIGNKIIYPTYLNYLGYDFITIYGNIYKGRIVIFDIPLNNSKYNVIVFYLCYDGINIEILPSLGWFAHIPNIENGYYNSGEHIAKIIENRLYIYKYNESLEESFENLYCKELVKIKKFKIIELRNKYFRFKKQKTNYNKKIWIINDKLDMAGDNGEYFFRYLNKIKPQQIEYYFLIKSNTSDYMRLSSIGNVIIFGTDQHLNLFLKADKLISSIYDSWVDNPFGNERKFIRDIFHYDYIYIQHGIIKDDLTQLINKNEKNFNLIITSSQKEYKSIINNKYQYDENNIILTGLPRYDYLEKNKNIYKKEKIVLIFPTWRIYIKGTYDTNTHESIYSRSFKETDYFKYYNNFINNEELLYTLKKFNYTGIFCLHPYFNKQYIDFEQNNIIYIKETYNYQELILKSSLLVTDYSSIFFDFAYLEKPVIYTQFDYNEYRDYHYPKGYFDYKKNGFGPICYNEHCTIKKIKSMLKNDCSLKKKYLKRIKSFFKYEDENNCKRIYERLINKSYIKKIHSEFNNYIFFPFSIILILKILIIIKLNYYL